MIGILVKNRLSGLLGSLFSRGRGGSVSKASTAKKISMVCIAVLLVALLVASITMTELSIATLLLPLGFGWLYYAVIMLLTLTVGFVFSIFETKSELFECRDNDLLLSMPIKASDILASRIIVTLIYNYAVDALVIVPAIVLYGVYTKDLLGIFGGILAYLFIPLISSSLASAVGFLVAKISKYFKNKTLVSLIFSVSFLALYFWGYTAFMSGFEDFIANISANVNSLKESAPILYYIGAVALLEPLPAIVFGVASVVCALVAFAVISYNYFDIITANNKGQRVAYKEKSLSSSGILFAMVKKEFSRLVTSSTYMLNAGIGFVMPIILGVIALFNKSTVDTVLGGYVDLFTPLISAGLVLFISMGFISACSLSLEGSAFWIIKSMPISSRTVILAKTLPQIIISVPVSIISGFLFSISLGVSPIYWAFIILTSSIASVFFAFVGIIFNVLFPRFDYTSEIHVIKQSAASGFSMLSQMIISGAMIPLTLWFMNLGADTLISLIIILAIYIVLAVIVALVALIPCANRLSKMNV